MATASLSPDVKTKRDRMGYWREHLLVTPLVSEDMLANFFLNMKADNLLDIVFPEATVSLSWWLQNHQNSDSVYTLACMKEDPDNKKMTLRGMGWIVGKSTIGGCLTRAEIGQCFLRGVSPRETIVFGQLLIDFPFDHFDLSVLYGMTPEPNVAAVRFAKHLGMTQHGPLPSYTAWVNKKTGHREPAGAIVSSMTRAQWESRPWR